MVFVCRNCLNADRFNANGDWTVRVEDYIDEDGDVVVGDILNEGVVTYDEIECVECNATVDSDMSKEEADKIILGAYEWLQERRTHSSSQIPREAINRNG